MACVDCHQEPGRCRCQESSGALLPPLPTWRRELQDRVDAYRARRPATTAGMGAPRVLAFPTSVASCQLPVASSSPGSTGGGGQRQLRALVAVVAELVAEPVEAPVPAVPRESVTPSVIPATEKAAGTAPVGWGGERVGDERCLQLWLPMASAEGEGAAAPRVAARELRLRAGLLDAGVVAGASLVFALTGWASQGFPAFTAAQVRPLLPAVVAVPVVLAGLYLLLCAYWGGETAGMRACHLSIAGLDGPLTRAACRRRGWASVLSLAALGLGYAWVLCDSQQLSWHDAISRTCIIGEPAASAASPGDEDGGGGAG